MTALIPHLSEAERLTFIRPAAALAALELRKGPERMETEAFAQKALAWVEQGCNEWLCANLC